MGNIGGILIFLLGFAIVATASGSIALLFQKIKLPLVTGFLIVGILAGPHVAGLLPKTAIHDLNFINSIALAFIAYAAGSELYLKDMRSRFKSIARRIFPALVVEIKCKIRLNI